MRDLGYAKARLARLDQKAGPDCPEPHFQAHTSLHWKNSGPEPAWPPPDAPTHCPRCGAKLTYRHIVHVISWADEGTVPAPKTA